MGISDYAHGMLERKPPCAESWSELALTIMHDDGMTAHVMVTPELRDWIRERGYPVPVECSHSTHHVGSPRYCSEQRPACSMGICKRAIVIAGDW